MGENYQSEELSNAHNGFSHGNNEGQSFNDKKHCKILQTAMKGIAKQKPRFTFHRIKNVSRTSWRNVKQPKAQKTNKRVKQAHRRMEPTVKEF